MKILKSIFERPYLITIIAFLIAVIEPGRYVLYSAWLIFTIFTIFIASIIYAIIQKKWQRLILSFVSVLLLGITFGVNMFLDNLNTIFSPSKEIGDIKFYSKEIENSTGLKISKELKILSKTDTIVYKGFEREYHAECLYAGSSKIISELEKQIISKKEFIKVGQTLISQNEKFSELKSIYRKGLDGSYSIYFVFNKNNTQFIYKAFYY